ncbi:hypothetical protein [Nitrosomonas sp. Nm33]|uniref:hypothetical protein n=1 Tax=Nitrosomonas sp. Nm33 TaxID=133724 RepID=UPI000894E996|nr:hypothetical protein [Nitrosomonas sp. Nm33]SDY99203.1 hypothetical protein SAMN05421755_107812 [Nitrosomonas sp. Nm33]
MPTISNSHIPSPKSWEEFQEITLSAAKLRWKTDKFFGNGRGGQRQKGVDVYGTTLDGQLVGIQCKNSPSGLDDSDVTKEITKAESFQPALTTLYIATTSPRDARLQESVRKISASRKAAGKFSVDLLFWEDISADLSSDDQVFFRHYPQLKPDLNQMNQTTFNRLKKAIPPNMLQRFKRSAFGEGCTIEFLKPLEVFIDLCDDPTFVFKTEKFENKKNTLRQMAIDAVNYIRPFLQTDDVGAIRIGPTEGSLLCDLDEMHKWYTIINESTWKVSDFLEDYNKFITELTQEL